MGSVSMISCDGGADTTLAIEARGDFTIEFNREWIREMTDIFGSLRIEATNPNGPARIQTGDRNLTVLIMPRKVS